MKKAAVIPSAGIGDGLLMMIVCNHLSLLGYKVTIFHNSLHGLKNWCDQYRFKKDYIGEDLQSYDYIILQNDNTIRTKDFIQLRDKNFLKTLSIFYFTYKESKHPPLSDLDIVFNKEKNVADNLSEASGRLLKSTIYSKDIGLNIPSYLQHKKFSNRVVIHPTSGSNFKNWHKSKYIKLAVKLQKKGFSPSICLSPKEREDWFDVYKYAIDLPLFNNLTDLATYIYESGYFIGNDSVQGHIASYFNIPSIILANNKNNMKLWQPGWKKAKIIYPPSWIPNIKHLRLRDNKWQHFISVRKVLRSFQKLII